MSRKSGLYRKAPKKENQPPREALTRRVATVDGAPVLGKRKILGIRDRLGLSQPLFAAALNVSPETVKAWEQGKRTPDGAALRLLQLAEQQPDLILQRVRTATSDTETRSDGYWVRQR